MILKEKYMKRTYGGVVSGEGWLSRVQCDNCGRISLRWKSETIRYGHHFCDRRCKAEYMSRNKLGKGASWQLVK
jgi:hypothetical protein